MKLGHMNKRKRMKRALRNNAGRIASVAALLGVVVGIRRWRAMRAH
jgi:hypothetical protein